MRPMNSLQHQAQTYRQYGRFFASRAPSPLIIVGLKALSIGSLRHAEGALGPFRVPAHRGRDGSGWAPAAQRLHKGRQPHQAGTEHPACPTHHLPCISPRNPRLPRLAPLIQPVLFCSARLLSCPVARITPPWSIGALPVLVEAAWP